jgi:hypothetical protein
MGMSKCANKIYQQAGSMKNLEETQEQGHKDFQI